MMRAGKDGAGVLGTVEKDQALKSFNNRPSGLTGWLVLRFTEATQGHLLLSWPLVGRVEITV